MPSTDEPTNDSRSATSQSMVSEQGQTDATASDERIRERAYELYIERGARPGDGVGDWLQAEREYHGRR